MVSQIAKATIFGYGWKMRLIVLMTTLVSIALFFGIGTLIDSQLNTAPKAAFAAVLISFPVTQVAMGLLMARIAKRASKKS